MTPVHWYSSGSFESSPLLGVYSASWSTSLGLLVFVPCFCYCFFVLVSLIVLKFWYLFVAFSKSLKSLIRDLREIRFSRKFSTYDVWKIKIRFRSKKKKVSMIRDYVTKQILGVIWALTRPQKENQNSVKSLIRSPGAVTSDVTVGNINASIFKNMMIWNYTTPPRPQTWRYECVYASASPTSHYCGRQRKNKDLAVTFVWTKQLIKWT